MTPLVGLQREAIVDTTVGGYRIPRGSKIWVNVQSIHHNARFWPEPEVGALCWNNNAHLLLLQYAGVLQCGSGVTLSGRRTPNWCCGSVRG